MKERFKDHRFSAESEALVTQCEEITEDYRSQGLRLTLRQLYYQLVSKNIIPNRERSYKNLSNLVSEARLCGYIDWDAIEDRGRPPETPSEWDDVAGLVESAARSYRLPRWKGQETYCELWVEKQALAGVLFPLAHKHHVTLMVNKGYSSQSAMYESAKRFREGMGTEGERDDTVDIQQGEDPWYELSSDREGVLFYLGDFDPSGEDMVRDISARMSLFGVDNLKVEKIALTKTQIEAFKLPPNPAKTTDPRSRGFIEMHGNNSWEVDALPPKVLSELVNRKIGNLVDDELLSKIVDQEKRDVAALKKAAARIVRSS